VTTEHIKARMRDFCSRYFRSDTVRDDDDIFALGHVNSLFAMQMVMFVEKEFGVTVEDEDLDIENFRSLNAVVGLIERKRAAGGDL
jgi:methoxymalonate biosynthesis acyl carrier protein